MKAPKTEEPFETRKALILASEPRVASLMNVRAPMIELLARAYLCGVADCAKMEDAPLATDDIVQAMQDKHENLQQLQAIALRRVRDLERAIGPAQAFPAPQRKDGGEPCGECHIRPGETCDICGAARPAT